MSEAKSKLGSGTQKYHSLVEENSIPHHEGPPLCFRPRAVGALAHHLVRSSKPHASRSNPPLTCREDPEASTSSPRARHAKQMFQESSPLLLLTLKKASLLGALQPPHLVSLHKPPLSERPAWEQEAVVAARCPRRESSLESGGLASRPCVTARSVSL